MFVDQSLIQGKNHPIEQFYLFIYLRNTQSLPRRNQNSTFNLISFIQLFYYSIVRLFLFFFFF